jgi:hypothetical protein
MSDVAEIKLRSRAPSRAVAGVARRAFYKIARSVEFHPPSERALLNDEFSSLSKKITKAIHDEKWLATLKRHYSTHGPASKADYSNPFVFSGFDTLFFFKNLIKSCYISAQSQISFPKSRTLHTIVDLGCGSGVFGLSWHQVFNEISANDRPSETQIPPRIIFVDREDLQLRIAGLISQVLDIDQFSLEPSDVFDLKIPKNYLRLASYLFCGQIARLQDIKKSDFDRLFGMYAIIVDYEEILNEIKKQANLFGYNTHFRKLRTPVPSQFLEATRSYMIEARCLILYKDL